DEDDEREHRPDQDRQHGAGALRAESKNDPAGLAIDPADRRCGDQRGGERQPRPQHQRGAGGTPESVSLLPGHLALHPVSSARSRWPDSSTMASQSADTMSWAWA